MARSCVFSAVDVVWPIVGAAVSRLTFADLYRAEHAKMVRVAWLIIGSSATAEDLVHDAFIRVGRRFDRIDQPAAYLRVAVVNACRNELRRTNRMSDSALPELATAEPMSIELFDCLQSLDLRQRTAIVLRFIDDVPDDAIASILGVRRATVRSLIFRGLRELREVVER